MAELSIRLKKARLTAGPRLDPPRMISQREAGVAVGVTDVAVGQWEAGKFEPSIEMLKTLATFYGVREEWLILDKGEMFEEPYESRRAQNA